MPVVVGARRIYCSFGVPNNIKCFKDRDSVSRVKIIGSLKNI
ncbi:hypothetical protein MTBBW1_420017 [Desulfamplus magnetovallimortis]|uniref:Uncharacterized protein n=1 Tax=Desulfamplus magnetovallimortis TaxID=1246637 RepID=A0A1W1HH96_9BACT|nr:hypothetical protein MTBBW1_420017 [Desulfamplus magnetovallimortis]